jgi:hypothetical protein
MYKSAYALLMVCAVLSPGLGAAQEQPVLAQEYKGAEDAPVFWWTRREQEYTLQFYTGVVIPKTDAKCERGDAAAPPGVDRGSFFIGNTIACLRGLDPTFGARTLTLIDGRRTSGPAQTVVAAALPPAIPVPPPATPAQPPPEVHIWLLHRDGSIITPQRKSPVDPERKYCSYGRCESGFVYGFALAAGQDAVAVAYMMGDNFYIQKLQRFPDQQD